MGGVFDFRRGSSHEDWDDREDRADNVDPLDFLNCCSDATIFKYCVVIPILSLKSSAESVMNIGINAAKNRKPEQT